MSASILNTFNKVTICFKYSNVSVTYSFDDILLKSEHRLFNLLLDVWKERGVIEEDVSAIQYLKN